MHFAPGFKDPQVYLRSVQRVLINELEKYRPKEMTLRKSDQEGEENVDEQTLPEALVSMANRINKHAK